MVRIKNPYERRSATYRFRVKATQALRRQNRTFEWLRNHLFTFDGVTPEMLDMGIEKAMNCGIGDVYATKIQRHLRGWYVRRQMFHKRNSMIDLLEVRSEQDWYFHELIGVLFGWSKPANFLTWNAMYGPMPYFLRRKFPSTLPRDAFISDYEQLDIYNDLFIRFLYERSEAVVWPF